VKKQACPYCGHKKSETWRRVWNDGRKAEPFFKCLSCRKTFERAVAYSPNAKADPAAVVGGPASSALLDADVQPERKP
jgi:transposase-like protein